MSDQEENDVNPLDQPGHDYAGPGKPAEHSDNPDQGSDDSQQESTDAANQRDWRQTSGRDGGSRS